ncbi:MAG: putative acyltransferase [Myxococcaceae bacterium]|nr:putative acyltransferase [Myxococcaceae bacterium]
MLSMPWTHYQLDLWLRELFRYGHYAVDIFIVLSGYSLMLPVLKSPGPLHLRTFLVRRTLRIVPTYYAAMLLTLALIATCIGDKSQTNWDASVPVTGWDIASHVLLIHEWSAATFAKINYAFWSIGVEWKIYFLFPLLLSLRARWGSLRAALLTTGAGYILWAIFYAFDIFNPGPWGSSPYYTGLFAMGMCAADLGAREAEHPLHHAQRARRALWLSSVPVLVCSVIASFAKDDRLVFTLASGFVGAWSALLLLQLRAERAPDWLARALTSRLAVWSGRRGYSIYLLHAPIVQLVCLYLIRPASWLGVWAAPAQLTLSLAATVLAAHAFHRIAERPFHELSRRYGTREPGSS